MAKAPTRVPTPAEGQQSLGPAFQKKTEDKFKHHDFLIYAVMIVTAVAVVGMIIAIVTLFNDQAHFNNQTYKEEAATAIQEVNLLRSETSSLRREIETLTNQLNSINNGKKSPL